MPTNKIPIWYIILTVLAFTLLLYLGIIRPYLPLMHGEAIAAAYFDNNPHIGAKIPPQRYYASSWGDGDFAAGILLLALGILCLVLGVVRALNKLSFRRMCLIAATAAIFALMTLALTDFAARHYANEARFYIFWFAFFSYPVFLLWHFFDCQRPTLKRWLWPPLLLVAAYALAAVGMYFVRDLPFDMTERFYTYMAAGAAFIYLLSGSIYKKDKKSALHLRVILALGAVWAIRIILMILAGTTLSFHNEYKSFFLVALLFMTAHTLYTDMQELSAYQGDVRLLELKNDCMLENYQSLERQHMQIAEMKHETRHHLLVLRELCESGEHERLLTYLGDIQGQFEKIETPVPCDNRVIQAVLGHGARRARELGFEISFEIMPLPELNIADADLVSLLMNLLDNALEANTLIKDAAERFITVRLRPRPPYLCLAVTNARCGEIEKSGNTYASTKKDPLMHGHGLAVVRAVVQKYDGLLSLDHTPDSFSAEAVLAVIAP